MPITVEWDNPQKTIIRQTHLGTWTWEEYYAAADQTLVMLNSVDYQIHLMIDMQQSSMLPSGALSHAAIAERDHRNNGKVFLVGANRLVQSLYKVALVIRPRAAERLVLVNTVEEVYAELNLPFDSSRQS
jgi:hypothetical protein